jgi:hypothetical protein
MAMTGLNDGPVGALVDDPSVVSALSLLIFRDVTERELLLGVRRPSVTSGRHGGVLSTPTMRLPASLMGQILRELDYVPGYGDEPFFECLRAPQTCEIGVAYAGASEQAFAAEALISRKLGLAAELVEGRLRGQLSAAAIGYDLVYDPIGGLEKTLMLTLRCVLSAPIDLPERSPSYSRLAWVDSANVEAAVKARDPMLLLPDESVWEICLHGLCVRSAAFVLHSERVP